MFYQIKFIMLNKNTSALMPRYQPVDKPQILFLRRQRRFFRFSADRCGGKTPCKRKTAYSAVFQGRWGGIGGDRVQSENL